MSNNVRSWIKLTGWVFLYMNIGPIVAYTFGIWWTEYILIGVFDINHVVAVIFSLFIFGSSVLIGLLTLVIYFLERYDLL